MIALWICRWVNVFNRVMDTAECIVWFDSSLIPQQNFFHYWKEQFPFSFSNLFSISGHLNGVSHIRSCCCGAFSANINGAIGRALVSMLILPCLESSCGKAVLFASIWSHSNSISIWLLTLGSFSAIMTLLLSLDLVPLSGLPGFDSWLFLKDFGLAFDRKLFRASWMCCFLQSLFPCL